MWLRTGREVSDEIPIRMKAERGWGKEWQGTTESPKKQRGILLPK